MADVTELRERLEVVAEELAELAITSLKASVRAGATARPEEERRLTRARRAVEKAIALLDDREGADEA